MLLGWIDLQPAKRSTGTLSANDASSLQLFSPQPHVPFASMTEYREMLLREIPMYKDDLIVTEYIRKHIEPLLGSLPLDIINLLCVVSSVMIWICNVSLRKLTINHRAVPLNFHPMFRILFSMQYNMLYTVATVLKLEAKNKFRFWANIFLFSAPYLFTVLYY